MPKQEGQKSKLLTLLRILEQKTDEEHLLNVPQLVQLLEQQGIFAERKSICVGDIDRNRVIIRSGSQLATRDIDEPGIRLEDLLGDRPFVGCNHLDETIEMIKAGCGVAFALMPLDMDSPEVARVPLEPFEMEVIGLGYLRRNETADLRALAEAVAAVYSDKDVRPVFR